MFVKAVRGDMGLDSLQGRRDTAKLKWWYKVATMPEHRYSFCGGVECETT